eukprot:TRINITY_DN70593_c0_g1_i1.p3 TRINITY_DN70593_c0_g1~~TRINITY_DN70593_c0_g1_i1.p3  ORF type:complete len:151 (+),score=27.38 TRINITY_DN70593_c0_g1_i1:72-524(+)
MVAAGLDDSIVLVATKVTEHIHAALDSVTSSTDEPAARAKLFAPLIEQRRAALEEGGFASSVQYADALGQSTDAGARAAAARLQLAEEDWRSVLSDIDADANQGVQPQLSLGDLAPEFRLNSTQNGPVALRDLLAQNPSGVLLVFMRHRG